MGGSKTWSSWSFGVVDSSSAGRMAAPGIAWRGRDVSGQV